MLCDRRVLGRDRIGGFIVAGQNVLSHLVRVFGSIFTHDCPSLEILRGNERGVQEELTLGKNLGLNTRLYCAIGLEIH